MKNINEIEELKNLLTELWNGVNQKRFEEIADRINFLSPDPHWSDHIFHSEEFISESGALLLEELIEKIQSYKPIQLI